VIPGGDSPISLVDALVLGLVEGITEFLPISSTGHLILARSLLGLPDDEASHVFVVGIQMGAITAIVALYWHRLLAALRTVATPRAREPNLLWQIAIAAVPAVALGLLLEKWIDAHLFGTGVVIATMVLGGIVLLGLERWLRTRPPGGELETMPYRTAFAIGLWQCLALIPGTSRSAATIGGALWLALSRPAAAVFSFLVGLPILYGASLWKLAKHGGEIQRQGLLLPFLVATVVAFLSALCVVRPFVRFVREHSFAAFAWYRIAAGLLLAVAWAAGWLR
jgi:undecaprenyl-diphosphatase